MLDRPWTWVMLWWTGLCVVATVNVCVWTVTSVRLTRGDHPPPPGGRWQMLLSALFAFGCAFRSALPRTEAQRFCLYDSWWSNAWLARAVATVAELSLVAQWMLVLRDYAAGAGSRAAARIAPLLLPLIAAAEVFSWYTTLTTNSFGSIVEESLWAVTAMLLFAGMWLCWEPARARARRLIRTVLLFQAAYIAFMWLVDVPMYVRRWRHDQQAGKAYLGLAEGLRDADRRWIVTRRWEDWRHEIPWMSLYFSAGVWISIGLQRAPRYRMAAESSLTPLTNMPPTPTLNTKSP